MHLSHNGKMRNLSKYSIPPGVFFLLAESCILLLKDCEQKKKQCKKTSFNRTENVLLFLAIESNDGI